MPSHNDGAVQSWTLRQDDARRLLERLQAAPAAVEVLSGQTGLRRAVTLRLLCGLRQRGLAVRAPCGAWSA